MLRRHAVEGPSSCQIISQEAEEQMECSLTFSVIDFVA
jgi:hypothetical protein